MRNLTIHSLWLMVALLQQAHGQITNVYTGTAPNTGTGDPLRTAFQKLNTNDVVLWQGLTGLSNFLATPSAVRNALAIGGVAGTGNKFLRDDWQWVTTTFPTLGWFDVKSYGAVGDGVTDDTDAIQDAIDATAAAGGGIIWFPPGTYILRTNRYNWRNANGTPTALVITNRQNIVLMGAGKDVSRLRISSSMTRAVVPQGLIVCEIVGCSNVAFIDLTFDGNRQARGITQPWSAYNEDDGFSVENAEQLLVLNVKSMNTGNDAFDVDGAFRASFYNCDVINAGEAGFGVATVTNLIMVNCVAQDCGWLVGSNNVDNAGFAFDFGKFATIVGCIGISNWANLLLLSQNYTRVSDSVFLDQGNGTTNIWIVGGSRTMLQNCWVDTLAATPLANHVGVYAGPKRFWSGPTDFGPPSEVMLEDCYIRGQYAVWCNQANGVTARGLFLTATEGINIYSSTNVVIRDCVTTAGSVGVRVVSGRGISIAGNDFRPQAVNGAVIVNASTEAVSITGNRSWSTNWSFRLLGGPQYVTLAHNLAYGAVDWGAHRSLCADNILYGGIRFVGGVISNAFVRNVIGGSGIWYDAGSSTPNLANQTWLANTATNLWMPAVTNGLVPVPDTYGPWIGLQTNAPPAAPSSPGMAALWNSNGVVYLLTTVPGGATWAATNKLAP